MQRKRASGSASKSSAQAAMDGATARTAAPRFALAFEAPAPPPALGVFTRRAAGRSRARVSLALDSGPAVRGLSKRGRALGRVAGVAAPHRERAALARRGVCRGGPRRECRARAASGPCRPLLRRWSWLRRLLARAIAAEGALGARPCLRAPDGCGRAQREPRRAVAILRRTRAGTRWG